MSDGHQGTEFADLNKLTAKFVRLIHQERDKMTTAFWAVVKDFDRETNRLVVTPKDRAIYMPHRYEQEREDIALDADNQPAVPAGWYRMGRYAMKLEPEPKDMVFCIASMVPTAKLIKDRRAARLGGTSPAEGARSVSGSAPDLSDGLQKLAEGNADDAVPKLADSISNLKNALPEMQKGQEEAEDALTDLPGIGGLIEQAQSGKLPIPGPSKIAEGLGSLGLPMPDDVPGLSEGLEKISDGIGSLLGGKDSDVSKAVDSLSDGVDKMAQGLGDMFPVDLPFGDSGDGGGDGNGGGGSSSGSSSTEKIPYSKDPSSGLPELSETATNLPVLSHRYSLEDIVVMPFGGRAEGDPKMPGLEEEDATVFGAVDEPGTKFLSKWVYKKDGWLHIHAKGIVYHVPPSDVPCGESVHRRCKPQPPGMSFVNVEDEDGNNPPPNMFEQKVEDLTDSAGKSADDFAQALGAKNKEDMLEKMGAPSDVEGLLDEAGIPSISEMENMTLGEAANSLGIPQKKIQDALGSDTASDLVDKAGASDLQDLKNTKVKDVLDATDKSPEEFLDKAADVAPDKAAKAKNAGEAVTKVASDAKDAGEDAKEAAQELQKGNVDKAVEKGEEAFEQAKEIVDGAKKVWDTVSSWF